MTFIEIPCCEFQYFHVRLIVLIVLIVLECVVIASKSREQFCLACFLLEAARRRGFEWNHCCTTRRRTPENSSSSTFDEIKKIVWCAECRFSRKRQRMPIKCHHRHHLLRLSDQAECKWKTIRREIVELWYHARHDGMKEKGNHRVKK